MNKPQFRRTHNGRIYGRIIDGYTHPKHFEGTVTIIVGKESDGYGYNGNNEFDSPLPELYHEELYHMIPDDLFYLGTDEEIRTEVRNNE